MGVVGVESPESIPLVLTSGDAPGQKYHIAMEKEYDIIPINESSVG